MRLNKLLQELNKLSSEQRSNHAENLCTNPAITIEAVRYSQGYINALDWIALTIQSIIDEERRKEFEDDDQ